MNDQELKKLVAELHENLNAVYTKFPNWKKRGDWPKNHNGSIIHSPATPAAIEKWAKKFDHPVPPSFKHFLSLHNGWEHFWLDFTIIGVDGAHTETAAEDIMEITEECNEELEEELGKLTAKKIADWEKAKKSRMHISSHMPVGTSFAGEYFVFDRRTADKNGEMEIVYWTIDYGAWEDKRFANFYKFLEWARDEAANEMKPKKKKSA